MLMSIQTEIDYSINNMLRSISELDWNFLHQQTSASLDVDQDGNMFLRLSLVWGSLQKFLEPEHNQTAKNPITFTLQHLNYLPLPGNASYQQDNLTLHWFTEEKSVTRLNSCCFHLIWFFFFRHKTYYARIVFSRVIFSVYFCQIFLFLSKWSRHFGEKKNWSSRSAFEYLFGHIFLFFAAYVICKKNHSFSKVVFLFFQTKIANFFYSKINDSSRVRTTAFSSIRFGVRVSLEPNIFTIYPKHFLIPEISETLKGSFTKFFGIARPKIFDGKTWYPPFHP